MDQKTTHKMLSSMVSPAFADDFIKRRAAKFAMKGGAGFDPRTVEIGKNEKLVLGDGKPHLETNLERFAKSMLPPQPSTPIQKAICADGRATMHVKTVGGRNAVTRGFEILRKRAEMRPADPNAMPTVNARTGAGDKPGLSDEDAVILENLSAVTSLTPAQASEHWKTFMR